MLNVLVTKPIPDAGLDKLRRKGFTVNVVDHPMTAEELAERVSGHAAMISTLSDRIDAAFLARNPQLKLIAQYAVGFDNIDLAAATRNRVIVTNTPDVLTDATADMAWALMLAASRRVVEGDRFVRAGEWGGWEPLQMLGWEISGKTLGIIGFGRIGRAVAKRAAGFSMRVLYTGRRRADNVEAGAQFRELSDLLREADFISINCPLTPETRGLIGAREFAMMKRTTVLVNTARGPVVDEAALADALRNGTIAAAGIDVYEKEPQVHPGLLTLPNVVLAPHLGSATHETRNKMSVLCADNIIAYVKGEQPPTILNPEAME